MKQQTKRIGRPPKEEGTHLTEGVTVRFTQATIRKVGGRDNARQIAKQAVEQAAIDNSKNEQQ